jgi:hypothetical protein
MAYRVNYFKQTKAKNKYNAIKQKSLPALKKDLDKVFNTYIRKRDSKDGYFKCISCGMVKSVDKMHAGHFYSAGHHSAIRWDEYNVNGQCNYCNTYLHGNLLGYREGLIKKYNAQILEILELRKHNKSKMMRFEIEYLIQEYKNKLKTV